VEQEIDRIRARQPDRAGGDSAPVRLAERLLMLGQHETAWHDPVMGCHDGSVRHVAPWVRATAAHARLATPLLAAARWAGGRRRGPSVTQCDTDGDGETELVLAHENVWCLVSAQHGARLTMMCHRRPDDCSLIVGNPADHWNFQEQLHRFMDSPAAHPGALTDSGRPHDAWHTRVALQCPEAVVLDLRRLPQRRAAYDRRYALVAGIPGLMACIRNVDPGHTIDSFLTPDYLMALTRGRNATQIQGDRHLGWRHGPCVSWIGFDPRQARATADTDTDAGHGYLTRLCPVDGHLDMIIGAGPVNDDLVDAWLTRARSILHRDQADLLAGDGDRGAVFTSVWAEHADAALGIDHDWSPFSGADLAGVSEVSTHNSGPS